MSLIGLHKAVNDNDIEEVKNNLEFSGELLDGISALMLASEKGNEVIVKMLIPFELNMKSESVNTALMIACRCNHINCAF